MSEIPAFDLREFLPYLLNQAAESSSLAFQKVYKERYGMLRTEWRVLFHLGIYGDLPASDIGARAKMHKTKISRAVQALEDRRFLMRRKDDNDKRVEHLSLTVAGKAAYADLFKVARHYDETLAAKFTQQEVALLRDMLGRLSAD